MEEAQGHDSGGHCGWRNMVPVREFETDFCL